MKIAVIKKGIGKKIKEIKQEHRVCFITFVALIVIWTAISIFMKYAPFGKNSMTV